MPAQQVEDLRQQALAEIQRFKDSSAKKEGVRRERPTPPPMQVVQRGVKFPFVSVATVNIDAAATKPGLRIKVRGLKRLGARLTIAQWLGAVTGLKRKLAR